MKSYNQTTRERVIEMYANNHSISSISRETGIARSTIHVWIRVPKAKLTNEQKEIRELKKQVERLQALVNILQEVPCSTQSNNLEKCWAILSLENKYGETHMCEALKLPRGTYFNFKKRGKKGNTVFAKRRKVLTNEIEKLFKESRGIYGSPKICALLRKKGYSVSEKYVDDIMHENQWFASRGGAKTKYLNLKRKNLLKRQFIVPEPNQVWVGDVTYFDLDGKKIYLCAVMDLFSRKIIAYRTSTRNSTQLTKRTFMEAFESRNCPKGLMFHSDQGSNYTSRTYQKFLRDCNVLQSFSKPGTPYDNSVMESFFKNLKNERLYSMNPKTEKEYIREINWYMNFYNGERPHETLQYKTPNEAETLYYEALHKEDQSSKSDN